MRHNTTVCIRIIYFKHEINKRNQVRTNGQSRKGQSRKGQTERVINCSSKWRLFCCHHQADKETKVLTVIIIKHDVLDDEVLTQYK